MKKNFLVLTAALGMSSLAHADFTAKIDDKTTVGIGVWLDLGVRRVGTADGYDNTITSSGPPLSRVMFKGTRKFSEDFYAFGYLEHRLRPNTGENAPGDNASAPGQVQLYRHSWLGLGGKSWGELRLGKMLAVLQEYNGGYEPWLGGTTVASVHTGGIFAGVRQNNTIYYKTPDFSGLRGHFSVSSIDNNTNNATITNPKTLWATGAQYQAGPVSAAIAFDSGVKQQKTKGFYGSYNFGVAKLLMQWETGDNGPDTASITRRSFSATIPRGQFTYLVGYLNGPDEKRNKFGAGLEYAYDSQLGFYADIGLNRGDGWTAAQRKTQLDAGLRIRF